MTRIIAASVIGAASIAVVTVGMAVPAGAQTITPERLHEIWERLQADPMGLAALAAVALFVLVLLVMLLKALFFRSGSVAGVNESAFDTLSRLRGRMERLEAAFNELKTEALRGFEFSKIEFAFLREELTELKRLAAGGERREPATPPGLVGVPDQERHGSQAATVAGPTKSPGSADEFKPNTQAWSPSDFQKKNREGWQLERKIVTRGEGAAAPSWAKRILSTRCGLLGQISKLFNRKAAVDEEVLAELEMQLVAADMGVATAQMLLAELRREISQGEIIDETALRALLQQRVADFLNADEPAAGLKIERQHDGPWVVLLLGVNGSGKTTTCAKLAQQWTKDGHRVMLAAADTFRAAAVEQLNSWGARLGVPVVSGPPQAKPGAVVFDAMVRARQEGSDVLLIDTAGRLHTKSNLMQELGGLVSIIKKHQPAAPHEVFLVLDGSTGQNAISQAREFNAVVPVSGLIVTKLDGTPKGGVVVAIKRELNLPLRYIGVGEAPEDLVPFRAQEFAAALFGS